jgi:hypothetical protein
MDEFQDRVPPDEIVQTAHRTLEQFSEARVLTFVPALVHRYTREHLRQELRAS